MLSGLLPYYLLAVTVAKAEIFVSMTSNLSVAKREPNDFRDH